MELSARSGRVAIVASGQITTFEGNPLEITVWASQEQPFLLKWSFFSDPEVQDVAVSVEQQQGLIHLLCTNFDGPDGRGTSRPMRLLDVGTRRFWLHFRVFVFGKTEDKTLHYSIYVEDL